MRIGKLRHRVTLQQKGVTTRDSFGGEVITWEDVKTVWAEAEPRQLRERLEMRRQAGQSVIGFKVRTPFDASLDKRLSYEGAFYNITDIDSSNKHRGELLIIAIAESTAP